MADVLFTNMMDPVNLPAYCNITYKYILYIYMFIQYIPIETDRTYYIVNKHIYNIV